MLQKGLQNTIIKKQEDEIQAKQREQHLQQLEFAGAFEKLAEIQQFSDRVNADKVASVQQRASNTIMFEEIMSQIEKDFADVPQSDLKTKIDSSKEASLLASSDAFNSFGGFEPQSNNRQTAMLLEQRAN